MPIGIENFKEMIDHQYYYVDKTNFIKDVCNEKVALSPQGQDDFTEIVSIPSVSDQEAR